MKRPAYWVEAHRAAKDPSQVTAYGVHHITEESGRTCVDKFSVNRSGGWRAALRLAEQLRDQLNARAAA